MKRKYRLYASDILRAMESIEEFICEVSFEEFVSNDEKASAVVRKLEIIGGATKSIPDFIKKKNKDVSWKDMAGMRDKLIHVYFGVDYEIVWEVIKKRLPEIKPLMEQILAEER